MSNSGILESQFSSNLRYLRKRDKITLEELSRQLSVSKSSLSDYETRKTYPPLDVCSRLAAHFGVSLDAFDKQNLSEVLILIPGTGADARDEATNAPPVADCRDQLEHLGREVKLRSQQVEGLRTQLKLQEQLIDSKNGEIQSLRIQIQLLEEKIKLGKGY
jgi:transcriptional regulator with XRE-family HTH domain